MARITGTLTPTGQNPVQEECELGAKIQASTGCKTIFALYAFDEGKFPEDAIPWEYTLGDWWKDHLDETFLRLRRFTQWSGGRPPVICQSFPVWPIWRILALRALKPPRPVLFSSRIRRKSEK